MRRGKGMRIIAGAFKGRPLAGPKDYGIRPTTDRMREAIFNILLHGPLPRLEEVDVLDLYAGTGALGLEALSRGARSVTFVENEPDSLVVIRENMRRLRVEDRCTLIAADVMRAGAVGGPYGLIFLDPPYAGNQASDTLSRIVEQDWLAPDGIVIAEMPAKSEIALPAGLEVGLRRKYGRASVLLLRPAE